MSEKHIHTQRVQALCLHGSFSMSDATDTRAVCLALSLSIYLSPMEMVAVGLGVLLTSMDIWSCPDNEVPCLKIILSVIDVLKILHDLSLFKNAKEGVYYIYLIY